MASGFININDKITFDIRWTGFDQIIRLIINDLKTFDNNHYSEELINILDKYIPPLNLDENLEMGWGFIDKRTQDTTTRNLDLFKLNDECIELFWLSAKNVYHNLLEKKYDSPSIYPEFIKKLIDLKPI